MFDALRVYSGTVIVNKGRGFAFQFVPCYVALASWPSILEVIYTVQKIPGIYAKVASVRRDVAV